MVEPRRLRHAFYNVTDMKIGIVLHPYGEAMPGGLPQAIFGWAKALLAADSKNEYTIFLKYPPKHLPELPGKNWKVEVLGSGYLWLERIRRFPLDVCIFNTAVLPLFYRPQRSIAIVADFPYKHLPARSIREQLVRYFIGWYHGRSLKRARVVVAISHSTKDDVVKLFGIPEAKAVVIPHGFTKVCEFPEEKVDVPEKFFLFVGVIKERKNVLNALKAFKLFLDRHPQAIHQFVLSGRMGVGPYGDLVRNYITEQGLEERVVFLGHRGERALSYIYRRAEALVFPSIMDGFGLPILEAMSCGVPVITSNVFGTAELGAQGSSVLVDPQSVPDIERAMEQVVFDQAFRNELIKRGHTRARNFSWDEAGRALLNLIRAVHEGAYDH